MHWSPGPPSKWSWLPVGGSSVHIQTTRHSDTGSASRVTPTITPTLGDENRPFEADWQVNRTQPMSRVRCVAGRDKRVKVVLTNDSVE